MSTVASNPGPLCEAKTVGLVRYPTTLAPVIGTQSVTTQCADNAHRTSSSLRVTCDSGGNWGSQTPRCQCNTGYRTAIVNGKQICQSELSRQLGLRLSITCDHYIVTCLIL